MMTAVYHTTIAPAFPSAPAFVLSLTRMKDTLLVWVGTDDDEETKRLAADWAVAMPSRGVSVLSLIGSRRLIAGYARHCYPAISVRSE